LLDYYFHHGKTNSMDIFHDWQPREKAAMKRATAWLRAVQPREWAENQQQEPTPEEPAPEEPTQTHHELDE